MGFWGTIGSWICTVSGWLLIWFAISGIMKSIKRTPMKKLKFIEKAIKEGNTTLGKVSSYIVYGSSRVHEVEYAYSVNDKVYFVTYTMQNTDEKYNISDELQPGDVLQIYPRITIYYDAANPNKAVIKKEVFSSRKYLKQIKTKKKNKFRDIYKDWTGPVIL